MTPISYDYITEYMTKWKHLLAWYDVAINSTMKTYILLVKFKRGRLLPPDTWSYPIWDLHLFIKPKQDYPLVTLTEYDLFTEIYITELETFQQNICNGCGMPAGDADSSGQLVLSHFGTCMCSNVETNLSWTCLVSGLLNFEHPSVLLFCFKLSFVYVRFDGLMD